MLDFKTTSKTFFAGRKLHVNLHRPLTPVKKTKAEEIEVKEKENELEADKNKIRENEVQSSK